MTHWSPIVVRVLEDVLRALDDPTRRALLDALRVADGQSVGELGRAVPQLGRHAVLKHLGVLERADLVRSVKTGRERRCYLNPVPLVDLARRWLDDFGAAWGLSLTTLRDAVERPVPPGATVKPFAVHSIVIAATCEQVWQALTSEQSTGRWYFGYPATSTWQPGAPWAHRGPDGVTVLGGTVLEAEPPTRLVTTFAASWDDAVRADAPSTVTWTLEQEGSLCRVTVLHEDLVEGSATQEQVGRGWPFLLSNLKTLLETGSTLTER